MNTIEEAGPFTRRAVMIAFGLAPILLIVGLVRSPSSGESGARYAAMQRDMNLLLKEGGKAGRVNSIVKTGHAHISRQFAMEGWSADLVARYHKTLAGRGWQTVGAGKYCKDGMTARIVPHAGMNDGAAFNLVEMAFDGQTIAECADTLTARRH
jgi:hypothetical protein